MKVEDYSYGACDPTVKVGGRWKVPDVSKYAIVMYTAFIRNRWEVQYETNVR